MSECGEQPFQMRVPNGQAQPARGTVSVSPGGVTHTADPGCGHWPPRLRGSFQSHPLQHYCSREGTCPPRVDFLSPAAVPRGDLLREFGAPNSYRVAGCCLEVWNAFLWGYLPYLSAFPAGSSHSSAQVRQPTLSEATPSTPVPGLIPSWH